MKSQFITPTVSVFDAKGRPDLEQNHRLYDHIARGGVSGMVVLGSTGEFFSMSMETSKRFIDIAAAWKRPAGFRFFAGASRMDPDESVALAKPVIAPINQDAWARNLNYLDSPASELVAFYGLGRHHNLRLLRSLKAPDFAKSAFHPEMQREMTVADLIERMGGHGAGHLKQIEKLKAAASVN